MVGELISKLGSAADRQILELIEMVENRINIRIVHQQLLCGLSADSRNPHYVITAISGQRQKISHLLTAELEIFFDLTLTFWWCVAKIPKQIARVNNLSQVLVSCHHDWLSIGAAGIFCHCTN